MEEYVGYMAAFCTTIAFLPQAILVWKTKSTVSISFLMYSVFILGLLLWTAYGYMTHQAPIVIANIITTLLASSIWILKFKNKFLHQEK